MGTNYPPEIYDPHCWGQESFYDELGKRQKEEMDKKEKERKEKTKVEFISGTAKKPQTDLATAAIGIYLDKSKKLFESFYKINQIYLRISDEATQ